MIQRKELRTQRAEGGAKTHREPFSVAGLVKGWTSELLWTRDCVSNDLLFCLFVFPLL